MTKMQIDNMRLIYDGFRRRTRNSAGVDVSVPGWGDPAVVEYLDEIKLVPYFKDIIKMLVHRLGYVRDVSLRAAPYDFRKGPS